MGAVTRVIGSFWFKAALSVALLAALFYETDMRELLVAVARANPAWVFIAFVGYLGSQLISVLRWEMLARPLGFTESYSRYFTCYFSGMYLNLFAPSTVAGDIGRSLFLAGGQKRKTLAFTSVFADRALGFVALVWVGALAILLQPSYRVPSVLYYGSWIVPPATLAGWVWGPQRAVRLLPADNRWRRLVERDLAPYWKDWGLLLRTTLVAVAFHLVQIATQVALAWALNLPAPASFFFIFVPIVNVMGMIPISFSGIGIREGGYAVALASVGISRESAIALGLLSSAVVLASGLVAGLVFVANKSPAMPTTDEPQAARSTD